VGATVSDTAHEVEYEASAHTSRDRQVGPGCRRRHELPDRAENEGGPSQSLWAQHEFSSFLFFLLFLLFSFSPYFRFQNLNLSLVVIFTFGLITHIQILVLVVYIYISIFIYIVFFYLSSFFVITHF
jgi:hypothetical protein